MLRRTAALPAAPQPARAGSAPRSGAARRTGTAGLVALMAAGTLPAIGLGTANAAVSVGSNISVFPNRDMVVAVGYEVGEQLLVEVLRNDVVIGTTQGPAVDTPEGVGLEVNHGPLGAPQAGDCWTNFTPDIIGGDVIRVTAVGRPGAPADTMTVKNVEFTGDPVLEADGTVSVSGTTTPGTSFAVEFRRDRPEPRFRRGPFNPVVDAATGAWKATFRPTATSAEGLSAEQQRQIALNEASWLAVSDQVTETTLAELGEPGGVGAGCTGTADPNSLVGGLEPINITSGDVTFSGTARAGVAAVSVTVGGLGAREATVVADPNGGPSTWTLTVPRADLATLPDGAVAVTPRFDALVGATRNVTKDTVAPLAPTPSVPPGTYSTTQSVVLNKPAGEGTSKVYWEIGNSAVADPTEFSNLYTGQIAVTSTQTLKGRLIDAAGNPGAVGAFDYKIGTPPAAPAGLTASESTTAAGAATLRWSLASGATGYNVYRNDLKVNTTPLASSATSYTDTAAGLGDHAYVVRAVEANGIESLNSNVASVTIAAPPIPAGLSATNGNTQATLRWTAATGVANYRVYRDGVALPTLVAGSASSYTNTGLTNGTLYEYAITALDAGGNESGRTGVVQAVPQVPADTVAPTVTNRAPVPAATGVGIATNVTATFSEDVQAVSGTTFTLRTGTTAGTGTAVNAVVTYDAATRVATLNPTADLAAGATYTATLTGGTAAIRDAANNALATGSWQFTTAPAPAPADTVAPTVSTRAPAPAATGVGAASNVTATFSEGVQAVSGTTFTLRTGTTTGTGTAVSAVVTYDAATRVATLNPSTDLAAGATYTATLTGGTTAIRDAANNPLATTSWQFTTAAAAPAPADTVAPTVTNRVPAAAATGVVRANNITATFSENVQAVSGTTFTLRTGTTTGTGTAVSAVVTYDAATRVATLNPSTDLAASTTYTATLTGGTTAIRDAANNPLASTSWQFTTAATTVTTKTVTVPATAADTYVRQDQATTTFGTASVLNVDSEFTPGNINTRTTAYLRFTVPTLAAGERITGARLSVNVPNADGPTSNGPAIWRTANTVPNSTTAWAETSLNYSTQPARSGTAPVGNFGSVALGRNSTPVSGITAAGPVSFQLYAEATDGMQFNSKEATTVADRPQLILTIETTA